MHLLAAFAFALAGLGAPAAADLVSLRRAMAITGLLDRTNCTAAFVGARWVDDESPLTNGELGRWFGSGLDVLAFEADETECAVQRAAIAARPAERRVSREQCIGAVLADRARERVPFYVTGADVCSSLYEPDKPLMSRAGLHHDDLFPCGRVDRVVDVDTVPLDRFASAVHYMRCDVQGGDLDVLRGGRAALEALQFLQIEVEFVPLYKDQPLFADVDTYVRTVLGLEFVGFVDSSAQPRSRGRTKLEVAGSKEPLLHTDALYAKPAYTDEAPETAPYSAAKRDTLVRAATLLGSQGFFSMAVESLDFAMRWSSAVRDDPCLAQQAAATLLLAFTVPDPGAWSADSETAARIRAGSPLLAEAEAVVARAGGLQAVVDACGGLALRRGSQGVHSVTVSNIGIWDPKGRDDDRDAVNVPVSLKGDEAPRARAAEFCSQHAIEPLGECVEAVAGRLGGG